MPTAFDASVVTAKIEPWGWLTAFGAAGAEAGQDPYLLLQRSSAPSQQDVNLGHDQPYVEVSSQSLGWYGQIASAELRRDRLLLRIAADAQATIQELGPIEVTFGIAEEQFSALKQNLQNTFQGLAFNVAGT